jgi:hypothetical protein
LIGVGTFLGPFEDFLIGDFSDLGDAIHVAVKRTQNMLTRYYVYNEQGRLVYPA